ncbi:hypothetical protein C9374_013779 [Naegleria lovaniensis]|uniref:G8 domain-containing protein n=1 Tax=Naegleria lovaniensis TaxID=51637 RepID=A0AA88G5U2_NAELO|nr:uncharacterized protein C9374_013779 [Naegleria lovaniensis]KAG2370868.1 hypothetical protein C9374_013779 [Naegleria lovaniensis]
MIVHDPFVNAQTNCPHLQAGLTSFSSLPKWNLAGSDIVISSKVKMDQSPQVILRSITIENGGELIFDNTVLNVDVEFIVVKAGGKFIAGSETCPITNKIIVTFFGNRTTANVIGSDPHDNTAAGYKGLACLSGSYLQLYGDVNRPTWTNLGETAVKGSSTIKVIDNTQWKVGDEIVVTSTDYGELIDSRKASGPSWMYVYGNYFPDQNEVRTIAQVVNSKTFVLDRPLNFTHWGKDHARAEVGILNRNIVLQGDASSVNSQFGGHWMIRVVEQAEIQGVEVTRMGQKGLLGRYAVHFHVLGEQSFLKPKRFFIKESSIHHSFQRCVVVHDSNGLLIHDNVCFDSFGHQYFLEDGSEMGNEFIHNLGIRAKPVANGDPMQIIPSDHDVSIFWITNANNTWIRNAAVGGKFPFWFTMPLNVGGLSSAKYGVNNIYVRPRNQPLGAFKNNVAHSSNGNGVHVDDMLTPTGTFEEASFLPRLGPYNGPSIVVEAVFEGIIAYKNRGYGIWARGGPLLFRNLILTDNRIQMITPPGPSVVVDSLFIGESDNVGDSSFRPSVDLGGRSRPDPNAASKYPVKGFETYDNGGPQLLKNIVFKNFMPDQFRQAAALGQMSDAPFKHQTLNRYLNLTFENSNRVYVSERFLDGNKGLCVLDIDGSTTGFTPGGWLVANDSLMAHSKCIKRNDWKGYNCPITLEGYGQLWVQNVGGNFETSSPYGSDPSLNNPGAKVARMIVHDLSRRVNSSVIGGVLGGTFTMQSNVILRNFYAIRWILNIPSPPILKFLLTSSANNDWVVVSVQYPRSAELNVYFNSPQGKKVLTRVNSLGALVQDPMHYYYDSSGEHLYLYLRNRAGRSAFSERWGFSAFSNDGFHVVVNASCPNDRCQVDNHNLPAHSQHFVKLYHKEERYAGYLKPLVKNGANRGNGVVFATLLSNKRTLDVAVHHDLTLTATKMEVGVGDPVTDQEDRIITPPTNVKFTPYSVSRFSWELSVDDMVALLKGRLFVKLSTTTHPNGHLKGHLYCNMGRNSTNNLYMCSLPDPIPKAQPCDAAPLDAISFYDEFDTVDARTKWFLLYYNSTADVKEGIYSIASRNYTSNPICGASSIYAGIRNGGVIIGKTYSPSTLNFVDLGVYKYFEFFVRSLTPGELKLNVHFTEVENGIARDIPSLSVDTKYIQYYTIDDSRVTRVRIPVSDLAFTNKTSLNVIQRVVFTISNGVFKEFLII